jgi:integrase
MIPKKAAAMAKTYAATPDEVMAILATLEKANEWKARAAVGLMFFAGLRPGEARGARWEDYDGKRLIVTQSVWHTHTTSSKTTDAASPVPVIDTLADILAKVREVDGNPATGPILRGPSRKPLNLDNLSKRTRDALAWREVLWGMPSVHFSGAPAVAAGVQVDPLLGRFTGDCILGG